jgi:hypothetical protein
VARLSPSRGNNLTLCSTTHATIRDSAVGGCPAGSAGFDTIAFSIPGDGPHTIRLQSLLPEITSSLNINGLSQPGASCATNIPSVQPRQGHTQGPANLMIELDGSNLALGYEQVTTGDSGDVTFTATFTGPAATLARAGNLITSTATDPDGNTSEFSACTEAVASGPASQHLYLPLVQRDAPLP